MKKHPIVPFRDLNYLDGMSVENAESIIETALKNCPGVPLVVRPQNIINTNNLWKGRKTMRQKQEVKIEEIGNKL